MSPMAARILAAALVAVAAGCAYAQGPPAATCAPPYDALENKYQVASVKLDTPLNFADRFAAKLVPAVLEAKLNAVRDRLPIQPSQPFKCSDYEASMDLLSGVYGAGSIHPGEYFRMAVVIPEVVPCVQCDTAKTLDVIYHIYTSDPVYYATRVFEAKPAAVTRNLAPQGTIPEQGTLQPLPYLGFNSSRNLVFGSKLSMETGSGLLSSLEADASGSQNSATASLFMSGSRQFPTGWLAYLRWSLGYRYEDLPGDKLTLRSGRGVLSVLGASRASGALGVIARFGSSVEGGNSQAISGDSSQIGTSSLTQSSPFGAVKSYAGLTFNLGRQAFAGSYGIQFGSASASPSWDYTKHIANVSYSARILKTEHKPLTLDLQAGAGYIAGNQALIPVPERFFGGNVERNFIEGDPWHLPRNPLVRSFAENEFGRAGSGGGIGGRDFYSFNATVAQTLKARPVVPAELTDDASFRRKLGGQVANARSSDKLTYLAESSQFGAIVTDLAKATPLLIRARQLSAEIRGALPRLPSSSAVGANLKDLDGEVAGAAAAISSAQSNRLTGLAQVRTLAVGFLQKGEQDNCDALVASLITQILCSSQALNDLLKSSSMAAQAAALLAVSQNLTPLRDQYSTSYQELRKQAYLQPEQSAKVQADLGQIASLLAELYKTALPLRPASGPSDPKLDALLGDLREACGDKTTATCGGLQAIDAESISNIGDWLAIGTGELTPPFLTMVADDADAIPASPHLKELAQRVRQLEAGLQQTMNSLTRPPVEVRAIRDTKFTGRLLDVIFRELNLYAVAPFAMLDVARVGETHSPAFQRTRYAAGPGIRFSVVTFNVNLGYAFNINRQPGERFGSFYFSLSVSDLFR